MINLKKLKIKYRSEYLSRINNYNSYTFIGQNVHQEEVFSDKMTDKAEKTNNIFSIQNARSKSPRRIIDVFIGQKSNAVDRWNRVAC